MNADKHYLVWTQILADNRKAVHVRQYSDLGLALSTLENMIKALPSKCNDIYVSDKPYKHADMATLICFSVAGEC